MHDRHPVGEWPGVGEETMIASATERDTCVGAVLFTDLVGFTEYNESEGDAAALAVLEQQTRMMTAALGGRPRARIVKELGDGLMVFFGDPGDGLDAAVAMLMAVRDARFDAQFPLAIRMGLHHGEMLQRDDDIVGLTVNIAARIAALAGPAELLVSESAADDRRHTSGLRFEPVGPVTVKGLQEPVWLTRLSVPD